MLVELNPNEWRFVLLTLRTRQDDCRKITQNDYPVVLQEDYRELDARLEQVKMKIAEQI
jgi:hypothetical protein